MPVEINGKLYNVGILNVGGGDIMVFQTTGNSKTGVMSQDATTRELNLKQPILTAGSNITIDNNVISAVMNVDIGVNSVNSRKGNVTLTAADVDLEYADNTPDLEKPISNDTQNALNTKAKLVGGNTFSGIQNISELLIGVANSPILGTDGTGKVINRGAIPLNLVTQAVVSRTLEFYGINNAVDDTEFANVVADLQSQILAAMGSIEWITPPMTINSPTQAEMTQWVVDNHRRQPRKGDLIKDGDGDGWIYDGTTWGFWGVIDQQPASPSVSGIAKLYASTGNNTDGSINQSVITGLLNALTVSIALMATSANLDTHIEDSVKHITSTERSTWNAKPSQADLNLKASQSSLDTHVSDTTKHITSTERTSWNAKPTTADLALKASQTSLDTHVNNTNVHITSAERTKLAGIEAGAEVNVQSDWNQSVTTADDYIKNKPIIPSMSNLVFSDGSNATNSENVDIKGDEFVQIGRMGSGDRQWLTIDDISTRFENYIRKFTVLAQGIGLKAENSMAGRLVALDMMETNNNVAKINYIIEDENGVRPGDRELAVKEDLVGVPRYKTVYENTTGYNVYNPTGAMIDLSILFGNDVISGDVFEMTLSRRISGRNHRILAYGIVPENEGEFGSFPFDVPHSFVNVTPAPTYPAANATRYGAKIAVTRMSGNNIIINGMNGTGTWNQQANNEVYIVRVRRIRVD